MLRKGPTSLLEVGPFVYSLSVSPNGLTLFLLSLKSVTVSVTNMRYNFNVYSYERNVNFMVSKENRRKDRPGGQEKRKRRIFLLLSVHYRHVPADVHLLSFPPLLRKPARRPR